MYQNSLKSHKKPLIKLRQRLFLWVLIFPLILLTACTWNSAKAYNYSIKPETLSDTASESERVKIHSSYLIKSKSKDSLPVVELSDLAWDADEQLLYAISDEGLLYHLTFEIKNKQLRNVKVLAAMPLLDKQKQALQGKFSDAEGLSLINGNNGKKGDSELLISFENKPRIAKFKTDGHFLKKVKTVKRLRKRKFFRARNKALESVVLHPEFGIMTAYSSTGKEWHFNASKVKNSSITALEILSDNNILILERAYNGLLSPVVISLRQLHLDKCDPKNFCKVESLARLDSSEGWILDNFEGLTKISNNQYLMISDNNNNPLQKTILVLFEVTQNND